MRMTEFFSHVNSEIPLGYVPYHLDLTAVRQDKKVRALKKAITKRRKEESKLENKGRRDGTEDIDIFEDM